LFVGHYGPSFLAQGAKRQVPLWVLFVAVQWLDFVWAALVLLGIEKVRIVPGFTAASPLDLYYMPYDHSLPAALIWAVLLGSAYFLWRPQQGRNAALIVGAAVFSHWVLDLVVHPRDLAIWDDRLKVGLGLWNYPITACIVEATILLSGFLLSRLVRRISAWALVVGLLLLQGGRLLAHTTPSSATSAAITLLAAYTALTVLAALVDRQ
jgi:hypothetical protein